MKINRTRLLDRKTDVRDASLCVVATEGEVTEKQYFDRLFQNPRMRVVVLATEQEDHCSAPHHVLSRLDAFRDRYDIGAGDSLWLMIDVDHHRPEELSPICQQAIQKGIGLAISNPCFELWLYLHHADPDLRDVRCQAVKTRLRAVQGSYNPTNLNIDLYRERVRDAVLRAKTLDNQPNERWPSFPGTHVYRVVETLLAW